MSGFDRGLFRGFMQGLLWLFVADEATLSRLDSHCSAVLWLIKGLWLSLSGLIYAPAQTAFQGVCH